MSNTPVLDSKYVQSQDRYPDYEFHGTSQVQCTVKFLQRHHHHNGKSPRVPKKISTGRVDGEKTAVDVHDLIFKKLGKLYELHDTGSSVVSF